MIEYDKRLEKERAELIVEKVNNFFKDTEFRIKREMYGLRYYLRKIKRPFNFSIAYLYIHDDSISFNIKKEKYTKEIKEMIEKLEKHLNLVISVFID